MRVLLDVVNMKFGLKSYAIYKLLIFLLALSALYKLPDALVFGLAFFDPSSMVMKDNSEGPLKGGNSGTFKHYNTVAPEEERIFPLFDNRGKTAIVTGAGAGIGLAVAQGFAESGANVAIWYHGNRKAIDRAKEIEDKYGVKSEKQTIARSPSAT